MDINKQRKIAAILRILAQSDHPMGSSTISRQLNNVGIDLRDRMVRYYLDLSDQKGLTENLGRRGRIITNLGRKELDVAVAIDKVGFINSRIDELAYRMNFDETTMTGTVILNSSLIKTLDNRQILNKVAQVMNARLGMGRFFQTSYAGQNIHNLLEKVSDNHIAVSTICSVTINGILLRYGISMTSRFGGLLELKDGVPVRFSQIINYDASTVDPLEIFIKSKMTSVSQTIRTGTGSIGASFREIPATSLPEAKDIIENLDKIGLGCVLVIGRPNQPLLDIPVNIGHVGLIVTGGLNPIAAIEEDGIATTNHTLHHLCNFDQLQPIESNLSQ